MIRALAKPLARAVTEGAPGWMPLGLFRSGEQGIWLDPGDLSTLFQDAAGTVPVTAAGQPVGRVLDKSGRGNHASQATAASRPILRRSAMTGAYYLEFDGVDDSLSAAAIDFTGTDKVTLFAGIQRTIGAAGQVIVELSPNSANSAGTLLLNADDTTGVGRLFFRSRGTTDASKENLRSSAASVVVTAQGDISGDYASVAVNGLAQTSVSDQGTGAYGSHPLYIGARAGTSLPFKGHLYGLAITGRLATGRETRAAERLMARRAGAVLA